jgi:WS/DGAT/MGAT family acyltransferase
MRLSLIDSLFFLFETHESPKHVAGLQVFELPPGRDDSFVSEIIDELRSIPVTREPFNLKLDWPLMGWPRWQKVEVNLEQHIIHERLPAPGTMRQLEDLVGRLHSPQLDRFRPAWQLYVIEGLEGGRFATFSKAHHAYADGITMVRWQLGPMARQAGAPLVPPWARPAKTRKKKKGRKQKSFIETARARNHLILRQLRAYPELFRFISKIFLQWVGLSRGNLAAPLLAPRSALSHAPESSARSAVTAALSLSEIGKLRKATDSTINEIVLAVCDMALHRYLDEHDAHMDEPLTLQMPISTASRGGDENADGGNQVALAWVKLGTERDPLARLDEIRTACREVKETYIDGLSPEAVSTLTIIVSGIAQVFEATKIDGILPPVANTLISNVPGPQETLYFGDAKMLEFYPISTILAGIALNITVFSYDGMLFFGVTSCADTLPGMEDCSRFIAEAFDELYGAAVK